jgi:hypothetical protein
VLLPLLDRKMKMSYVDNEHIGVHDHYCLDVVASAFVHHHVSVAYVPWQPQTSTHIDLRGVCSVKHGQRYRRGLAQPGSLGGGRNTTLGGRKGRERACVESRITEPKKLRMCAALYCEMWRAFFFCPASRRVAKRRRHPNVRTYASLSSVKAASRREAR